MHSQMPPYPLKQQGVHYMQHPQAAVAQQPGLNEFTHGIGSGATVSLVDVRGGTKQDFQTGSGDALGNQTAGHGSSGGGGVEPSYVKGSENGN
ncbi:hypothetical protein HHK36_000022 [Tetracentron sinense]|uniref:Uncharacterized protein n=1 Tax=Tetracentron sinense TaxID=13715 RepID=A0A835DTD1_TETSI|nr:hypothetical protein HHK36_000022 [Tetracentron sinense]